MKFYLKLYFKNAFTNNENEILTMNFYFEDFIEKNENIFDDYLMIKSIQINELIISFSLSKEKQFDELIKLINEKTNYEIIYNEKNFIPQFIQLKNQNEKNRIYLTNEFINEFKVNETIKKLLQNDLFPKNYLIKRFDFD